MGDGISVDIISNFSRFFANYAREFSTFSTGFSTRVFHSLGRLWIYKNDLHKPIRPDIPVFSLFRSPWFLPQSFLCAKIRDLTAVLHSPVLRSIIVYVRYCRGGARPSPTEIVQTKPRRTRQNFALTPRVRLTVGDFLSNRQRKL